MAPKQTLPIQSISLLVNEQGATLKYTTFRGRFTNARKLAGVEIKDFQFKDLRAKAATDVNQQDNIKKPQTLLGHANEQMTEHYVRHRLGKKASPVK